MAVYPALFKQILVIQVNFFFELFSPLYSQHPILYQSIHQGKLEKTQLWSKIKIVVMLNIVIMLNAQ